MQPRDGHDPARTAACLRGKRREITSVNADVLEMMLGQGLPITVIRRSVWATTRRSFAIDADRPPRRSP